MDECSGWALCGCSWMKTVPPVDGGYVMHLFPSFHPQLQARPAPDFWSAETHLARRLQPPWSRSRDDSSSALCWWRSLSARLGFLWRKASLLQSNGETTLTVVPIHIFHIQHSWIMFIRAALTGFLYEDKSARLSLSSWKRAFACHFHIEQFPKSSLQKIVNKSAEIKMFPALKWRTNCQSSFRISNVDVIRIASVTFLFSFELHGVSVGFCQRNVIE